MKVALLNPYPARSVSTERTFIQRCLTVLPSLGHKGFDTYCTEDLLRHKPDVVLALGPLLPKLTPYFTAGLLWQPARSFLADTSQQNAIRSWDMAVPAGTTLRRVVRDLCFPTRLGVVSDADFLPGVPDPALNMPATSKLGLVCLAARPIGPRQERLLQMLAEHVDLSAYGDPASWAFLSHCFRGPAPDEPHGLLQVLNRHGVLLVQHTPAQLDEDLLSMQVLEGCAAKCLVITDALPRLAGMFGDSVLTLDMARPLRAECGDIVQILAAHRADPALHRRTVTQAHARALVGASLPAGLNALLQDAARRIAAPRAGRSPPRDVATITVVLRCGGRPLAFPKRAVEALARQTYRRIAVVVVRHAAVPGYDDWVRQVRASRRFTAVTEVALYDDGLRSRSLWAGFAAVRTELFCALDDDDEMFPSHLSDLAAALDRHGEADIAYTGAIRNEEDGALLNTEPRFAGDMEAKVPERRALEKFRDFDLSALRAGNCFIQSNAWLARRAVLTPEVLEDPLLEVAEDLYFYTLLASRHAFCFTGTASALWNWRSRARDNSALAVSRPVWDDCHLRLRRRLRHVAFPARELGLPSAEQLVQPRRHVLPGLVDSSVCEHDIAFDTPRRPDCVTRWHGLCEPEEWGGRWTEGPELMLCFTRALPPRFDLRIFGFAFESNHGLPISITVGECVRYITMATDFSIACYQVAFENPDRSDTVRFAIPRPESPSQRWGRENYDNREIGIGLLHLQVVAC